jgi:UDPglucose 6-dehydrogenase
VNIVVQGLWHLGTVTAACLASITPEEHRVVGLDFDDRTIEGLTSGVPPLFEPGLEELLKQGLASGRLRFTTQADAAVRDIELLWITYDTPVDDNDNADIDYVIAQVCRTLPHLPRGVMVLVSSQLPVGTIRRLEILAAEQFPEKEIAFACSPENLRLGKAIDAFRKPDRVVVGVRSERDKARLSALFRPIAERVEWMSVESAEMTKHAINAFLATSIAFANEIASVCERVGADAKEVERGLKSETRIGPKAYVAPGAPFAGGTLARDIAFLNSLANAAGLTIPLLSAVRPSNEEHKLWVRRRLRQFFPDMSNVKVAIWGMTYKPGTDTLRGSPAIELCRWLAREGAAISVHDPVVGQLPQEIHDAVVRHDDPIAALQGAAALVVFAEWPQYKNIAAETVAARAPGIIVLDVNRFLSSFASNHGLRYMAVGTPD